MEVKYIKLLHFLINLILCYVQCELKSILRKAPKGTVEHFKYVKTEYISVSNNNCGSHSLNELTDLLGAAFNPRYMSISEPKYVEEDMENLNNKTKRNSNLLQSFYVDDTFALEISDKPAWEVKLASNDHYGSVQSIDDNENVVTNTESVRSKRHTRRRTTKMRSDRPWDCEGIVTWIDLGPDYHPRFLRTIECTKKKCWYNHYVCKPRSFTVQLLRRRNGECVPNYLHPAGNDQLPAFVEKWVWEERALNFCCDCVVS